KLAPQGTLAHRKLLEPLTALHILGHEARHARAQILIPHIERSRGLAGARDLGLRVRDDLPALVELALHRGQLRARTAVDLLGPRPLIRNRLRLGIQALGGRLRIRVLATELLGPPRQLLDLAARHVPARLQVVSLAGLELDLALGQANLAVDLVQALLRAGQPPLLLLRRQPRSLDFSLLPRKLGRTSLAALGQLGRRRLRHLALRAQRQPPVAGAPELDVLHLGLVLLVALGLLGLAPERSQLLLDLAQN